MSKSLTVSKGQDFRCGNMPFSWTNDKDLAIDEPEVFIQSVILAYDLMNNGCDLCTTATHFHTRGVEPYWAEHLTLIGAYGNHVFYRE